MKVFISYAHDDANKRRALVRTLRQAVPLIEPIVIDDRRAPGVSLAEKVTTGIDECGYFVPILTRNSISNQWVNQEIGYAKAARMTPLPLVAADIRSELKGFVHEQLDLPFWE